MRFSPSLAITVVAMMILLGRSVEADYFPSHSCPLSSPAPIGCYCTYGCSINGDKEFSWTMPVWPPAPVSAITMGEDTICAKITIPIMSGLRDVMNLAQFLGITGQVHDRLIPPTPQDQSEVTIYTSFSGSECSTFQKFANIAAHALPSMKKLFITLCTENFCNAPDAEAVPPPQKNVQIAQRFPGSCPRSNTQPTGCFCTNRCHIGDDNTVFKWQPNVWPPAAERASYVGTDTICARITVPIVNDPASVALANYLGISGNVSVQYPPQPGPPANSEVTVYTALTNDECARVQQLAGQLLITVPDARKPLIYLCTDEGCNYPGAVEPLQSTHVTPYIVAALVVVLVGTCAVGIWRVTDNTRRRKADRANPAKYKAGAALPLLSLPRPLETNPSCLLPLRQHPPPPREGITT